MCNLLLLLVVVVAVAVIRVEPTGRFGRTPPVLLFLFLPFLHNILAVDPPTRMQHDIWPAFFHYIPHVTPFLSLSLSLRLFNIIK